MLTTKSWVDPGIGPCGPGGGPGSDGGGGPASDDGGGIGDDGGGGGCDAQAASVAAARAPTARRTRELVVKFIARLLEEAGAGPRTPIDHPSNTKASGSPRSRLAPSLFCSVGP